MTTLDKLCFAIIPVMGVVVIGSLMVAACIITDAIF